VDVTDDGEEGVFGFRHGIICWDCLLGLFVGIYHGGHGGHGGGEKGKKINVSG
jgi:hypothetical protein